MEMNINIFDIVIFIIVLCIFDFTVLASVIALSVIVSYVLKCIMNIIKNKIGGNDYE